jgi:hypothetical protein
MAQTALIVAGERKFYEDASVLVTDKRLVIVGKTYAMANVTSVQITGVEPPSGPVTWCVILALIFGGFAALILLGDFRHMTGLGLFMLAAGLGFGGCAYYVINSYAGMLSLRVSGTSGEVDALQDFDRDRMNAIVEAVTAAIVSRG